MNEAVNEPMNVRKLDENATNVRTVAATEWSTYDGRRPLLQPMMLVVALMCFGLLAVSMYLP